MTSRQNEIPDELFVTVDDKVSTPRGRFFVLLDELCRGHALQITSV